MDDHIILAVHITQRLRHVPDVQARLTEYGCNIKTRLGLHEVGKDYCSPNGLLILEMAGEEAKILQLEKKLKAIEGIEVKKIVFEHE
jgi:hypothetical protein